MEVDVILKTTGDEIATSLHLPIDVYIGRKKYVLKLVLQYFRQNNVVRTKVNLNFEGGL